MARTTRWPLRGSGSAAAASGSPGQTSAASASTAASDTISPPTLAKRLARPTIDDVSLRADAHDVAGVVPAALRRLDPPVAAGAEIAGHDVRARGRTAGGRRPRPPAPGGARCRAAGGRPCRSAGRRGRSAPSPDRSRSRRSPRGSSRRSGSRQSARVAGFTGSAPATTARSVAKCSAVARRPQPARKVSVPTRIVAPTRFTSSGITR